MYLCVHLCFNVSLSSLAYYYMHFFICVCVCVVQECRDHDPHADGLHGADGSRDSFLGKPLVSLHREGSWAASLRRACFVLSHFVLSGDKLHFLSSSLSFQIASFVNAKATDASIQQVSLDILESMVLSSHSLFLQVKQGVTMERLIAHLQV